MNAAMQTPEPLHPEPPNGRLSPSERQDSTNVLHPPDGSNRLFPPESGQHRIPGCTLQTRQTLGPDQEPDALIIHPTQSF